MSLVGADDSGMRPDFLAHSLNNIFGSTPTMIGEVKGADVVNDVRISSLI